MILHKKGEESTSIPPLCNNSNWRAYSSLSATKIRPQYSHTISFLP